MVGTLVCCSVVGTCSLLFVHSAQESAAMRQVLVYFCLYKSLLQCGGYLYTSLFVHSVQESAAVLWVLVVCCSAAGTCIHLSLYSVQESVAVRWVLLVCCIVVGTCSLLQCDGYL